MSLAMRAPRAAHFLERHAIVVALIAVAVISLLSAYSAGNRRARTAEQDAAAEARRKALAKCPDAIALQFVDTGEVICDRGSMRMLGPDSARSTK